MRASGAGKAIVYPYTHTHTEVISYTVQGSYVERLCWQPTLIIFDLKLVVPNMQPGCQGGGSPAVSRPFSCLLQADKEAQSNPI